MMDKNLEYLEDAFRDHIERISNALAVGNCGSFEEYKFLTGQIRGLMAACRMVDDLKTNLENLDD